MILIQVFFLVFVAAHQEVPSDTVITLKRTECFGPCPSYELTISADGMVVFIGHRNVKKPGTFKSHITQDQLKLLVLEFERIDYFSLQENYGAGDSGSSRTRETCPQLWTDNPSAYTSLTINGRTKEIAHYHGCRGLDVVEKLTTLEDRIDEIVNAKQWVK